MAVQTKPPTLCAVRQTLRSIAMNSPAGLVLAWTYLLLYLFRQNHQHQVRFRGKAMRLPFRHSLIKVRQCLYVQPAGRNSNSVPRLSSRAEKWYTIAWVNSALSALFVRRGLGSRNEDHPLGRVRFGERLGWWVRDHRQSNDHRTVWPGLP